MYYRVSACHGSYCSGWTAPIMVVNPGGGPPGGGCPLCNPRIASPGGGAGTAIASTWRYVLHYAYDATGSLTKVYGPSAGHPYWQLNDVNAAGAVTKAHVNGGAVTVRHLSDRATGALTRVQATGWSTTIMDEKYSYDVWGRRTERHDMRTDAYENYGYDDNNRLTSAVATLADHTSVTTLNADYDDAGNFTSKTNRAGTIGYTYAAGNDDKLASVSGHLSGGFSYDNAGRIISGPDGLSASYNTRGLAAVLHKKSHTAALSYAPDGHRYRSVLDATQTVTYVVGGAFKIIQKDGVSTYRQAVIVGGVMVAQLTTRSNATHEFHYFYRDALGSIVAVAGESGSDAITRLAYGPFGKVRSADDWNSLLPPSAVESLNLPTRQGYTGGEALTALGLVHLGARIYDPALGRWLSPDPAGASVPYVYVGDNPLNDTDPNGQMSTGQILTLAALVVLTAFTFGALAPVLGAYLATICAGAVGGFAQGMIASDGDPRAGLLGAMSGAAAAAAFAYLGGAKFYSTGWGGTMEKAALRGFAGGALSSIEGGSFKDGFVGAFASSMAEGAIGRIPGSGQGAIMERTAVAAALGGTASRLTGGNFANGAWSAAFQHLFSEEGQYMKRRRQQLKYETFERSKNSWAIKWKLAHPSKKGGWIVQHITIRTEKGEGKYNYWEAWNVPANSPYTTYDKVSRYDDVFSAPGGWRINASARFYEGLKLPSSFKVMQPGFPAGILPASLVDPHLPTLHATAPVIRSWKSQW